MSGIAGSGAATGPDTPATARGRPRDARIDDAILDATLRLLGEVGYQAMSISAIAAAAGIGRPAIYRRYHSKADLVVAAVLRLNAGPEPVLPAHPRDALAVLLARTADALTSPGGLATLGSLLAQERRDPELLAAFRRRVFDPRHAVVHGVLRDGDRSAVSWPPTRTSRPLMPACSAPCSPGPSSASPLTTPGSAG